MTTSTTVTTGLVEHPPDLVAVAHAVQQMAGVS
jgi:hypothetical protein